MSSIESVHTKLQLLSDDIAELPPLVTPLPAGVNCLAGVVPPPEVTFVPWDAWTDRRVTFVRQQADIESGQVPWIGTSISAAMNVARVYRGCANFSIGGQTIRGALKLIPDLTSLYRASGVVVELGTNDAGYTQFEDMDITLSRLFGWFTPGMPLVVVSLIPQPNCSVTTCNAVNSLIAAKVAARPNSAFVAITDPLRGVDGWMKLEYSIGDRMHPNGAGYNIIRPLIRSALCNLGFTL